MVMKKLIVISVVFALVAGAAFAEVNFGGGVFGKVNVIEGNGEKVFKANDDNKGGTAENKNEVGASGNMGRVRLEASGTNDDETFGGWARLDTGSYGGGINGYAYAWWQPLSLLKFQVGTNGGDGYFDAWGGAGWGFYATAGDVLGLESWKYGSAFYGGFGAGGAILTITPLDALAINIGIPYFAGGRGEDVYKKTNAQVAYNINGVGKLAISYAGDYEGRDAENAPKWKVIAKYDHDGNPATPDKEFDAVDVKDGLPAFVGFDTLTSGDVVFLPESSGKYEASDLIGKIDTRNGSKFYAFFDLSSIENLGVQLSVGFGLPSKDVREVLNTPGTKASAGKPAGWDVDMTDPNNPALVPVPAVPASPGTPAKPEDGKKIYTVNYQPPVAIGLAASYDAGAFGIKARVQGKFAQSLKYEFEDNTPNVDAKRKSGSYEVKGPFVLDADILPSFAINDSMKVYLDAGLGLQAAYSYDTYGPDSYEADGSQSPTAKIVKTTDTVESVVGWHVNPYFTKSAGAGTFFAGFRLWSSGVKENIVDYGKKPDGTLNFNDPVKKAIVKWAVPVGVRFDF